MKKTNFFKIFSMVAFVALMAISCWATTESLHLLLPEWPIIVFWVVTIVFFVLSSLGTKLIVDSFNKDMDPEHPGLNIAGGILLLLFFWVVFSIPTNTHTFFYKSTIKDVLIQDLANTKTHLKNLADDQTAKGKINADKAEFCRQVDSQWKNVALEINNPGNPGWADQAEKAMLELENTLGTKIQRVKPRDNSHAARQELIEVLGKSVEETKLARCKEIYDSRLENIASHKDKNEIEACIKALTAVEKKIKDNPGKNNEPTVATEEMLTRSYVLIANYMDFLNKEFKSKQKGDIKDLDDIVDTYKTNVTQTAKMRSVINVWKGLFAGDPIYKGRGLWFWVILAVMIDVAGFIFFDIAFRKREY